MKNIVNMLLIIVGFLFISGCASTQIAPENLDEFSLQLRGAFAGYKSANVPHKAFAVAKLGKRNFYGLGYSYPTIEKAEKRALDGCYKLAREYRDDVVCFVYHSE